MNKSIYLKKYFKLKDLVIVNIIGFLTAFNILFIYPSIVWSDETFWIQEGKLKYCSKGKYIYLYNEREKNQKYFFKKNKKNVYSPTSNDMTKKELRLRVVNNIPDNIIINNYQYNQENDISQLKFVLSKKSDAWIVHKNSKEYLVYNTKYELSTFEKECFSIEEVKPNFMIDLSEHQEHIQNMLNNKNNEKYESEFIKIIEQYISQDFLDKVYFSLCNDVQLSYNCKSNQPLNLLYQSFLNKESENRQQKREDYQDLKKEIHDELDNFHTHKNDLQDNKINITALQDRVDSSNEKINNIKISIKDKKKLIEELKKNYQNNREAHAEYGLYVIIFKMKNKTIYDHLKEITPIIIKRATEDLSKIFIVSQSKLSYNQKTDEYYFNSWIEIAKKGDVHMDISNNDRILFGENFQGYILLKIIKFLPKALNSDDFIDNNSKKNSELLKNKYQIFPILKEKDLNRFISNINNDPLIDCEPKVLKRVQEKFKKIQQRRLETLSNRNHLYERFVQEVNSINNDIDRLNKKIIMEQKRINHNLKLINVEREKAKAKYQEAKKAIDLMKENTKQLINKIKDISQFNVFYSGSAAQQQGERTDILFSRLIIETFIAMDTICNHYRESIKSTVENGFLKKQTERSVKLIKKFKSISIYSNIAKSQDGQYWMGYVVLKLESEVVPNEELKPKSFGQELNEIDHIFTKIQSISSTSDKTYQKTIQLAQNKQTNTCDDSCLCVNNYCFSFSYFNNEQIYDYIALQIKTPTEIVESINDDDKAWYLPTAKEIQKLIHFIKSGNKLPYQISVKDKNIYSQGIVQGIEFPSLKIDNNFKLKEQKVYPGDIAYFILVSKK